MAKDDAPKAPKAKKEKKDDGQPKKRACWRRAPLTHTALSAYMIFSQEERPRFKEENPDATFGELGKIIGAVRGCALVR